MANLDALVTLKDIVEEFRLKSKLPQIEYANLKQLAIRGYQRMIWTILPKGQIVRKAVMNDNNMLSMPNDLVELNAIYIADARGQFWPLSKDRKMVSTVTDIGVFYGDDIPGVVPPDGEPITGDEEMIAEDTGDATDGVIRDPEDPYYEGVDVPHPGGRAYSATGGVNLRGYYIDDFPNRRILFANVDQSEIVIDYLSTGVPDIEEATVPVQAVEAIHAYMGKIFYMYREGASYNKIKMFDDNMRREEQKLRMLRANLEDFLQSIRKTLVGSIQR